MNLCAQTTTCFFSKEGAEERSAREGAARNDQFQSAMKEVAWRWSVDEDARKRRAGLQLIRREGEDFDRIQSATGSIWLGFNIASSRDVNVVGLPAPDSTWNEKKYYLIRWDFQWPIESEAEGYKIMNILDKLMTEARNARKSILSNPPGLTKPSSPVVANRDGSIIIKGGLNDTILLSAWYLDPKVSEHCANALNKVILQDELKKN
jgi:hypothetical protein